MALDYFGEHECTKCGNAVDGLTLFALLKGLETEAEEFCISDQDSNAIEEKIRVWQKILHHKNYLVLKLKKLLLDTLCNKKEFSTLSEQREVYERIVELGEEFMEVVLVLEPGYSLNRGRLLRQLHLPRLKLAEFKLKSGEISKQEFKLIAMTSVRDTRITVKCLEAFSEDDWTQN